jgi:hypothetical protein
MIVKPAISFLKSDSDSQLITDSTTINTCMTGNASYVDPEPSLPDVAAATNEFSIALVNAADGGVTLTSIKNDKRDVLVGLLRDLASYVQVACKGDITVLLSSGFPIQKPQRSPIGELPAPVVALSVGMSSGNLDCLVAPIFGAATYNWQIAVASAPDVILQTAQTTGGRNTFSGLTPGVTYAVQANAVGSAGASDWSKPVSQMAM